MGGRVALLTGLAALALAPAAADAAPRLPAFGSCADLVRYAARHVQPISARPLPATAGGEAAPAASPGAPTDVSGTNDQEAGVDEPDLVKTDGRTLFAVHGSSLQAVDARAATPRLIGSLDLPAGTGQQLLLHDGHALVIARAWTLIRLLPGPLPAAGPRIVPPIMPMGPPRTLLVDVDVHDPSAMRVVQTMTFTGIPVDARLTGASARVVVSSMPIVYEQPQLRASTAGWVPRATVTGASGDAASTTRRLVRCRAVRRPPVFSGASLLTVLTIDLDRGLPPVDADAVMTDAQTVYASPGSLYVATQRWDAAAATSTTIHRFDIADPQRTVYRASGTVPGHLLDQYALSERDGVLRAATTEGSGEGESFVTTLAERDGRLAPLGQVGGLGRGERIYAVRFLGDVGYVVTFRQVDPLYTVDLADPARPRVAGELGLEGYSAYLHPVGDGLLLGVGQDADEAGRLRGTQLELFDVSDPARPRRLAHRALGAGSSSGAEWDHHAFLWWPASKLAVLPLSQPGFTGAAGFRVSRAGGIDEAGRLGHDDQPVQRDTVVGERLFALTDAGMAVGRLDTLAGEAWVAFPPRPPEPGPVPLGAAAGR